MNARLGHLLWALALSTAPSAFAAERAPAVTVEVLLFSKRHPSQIAAQGSGGRQVLTAVNEALRVNGHPVPQPLALALDAWQLEFPEGDVRRIEGELSIRARGSELRVVGRLELEDYVAQVVAAETLTGTPAAALEAQAIVTRTYALAAEPRHEEARLCDLAHCQVLRGASDQGHLRAARQAARRTRGALLCLETGELALPVFHASCGGQTAAASEVFAGRDRTGSAGVPDPGCAAKWRADVPLSTFRAVIERHLGADALGALRWTRGTSGRVQKLQSAHGARALSGDTLLRELGARIGYGRVPSALFQLRLSAEQAHFAGRGRGHGVGLCQEGAARQARAGRSAEEILAHYFPKARLCERGASAEKARPKSP